MDEVLYYENGPSEWRYYSLGNVVKFEGGSQPPKKYFSNEKLEGMIRLIQIRDYKTNDFVTYVPKELCRRFCTKDDIMIGRYGPPIFQILRGIEGAYNVALIKASPNEEILDKLYLYYFMKNEHLFKLIDGLSQRTSGQTGIDMEVLKKYIIPVPSKEEQRKIASTFSTVDKQIDNVDGLIKKNKELKKGLMQQLLTKGIGHTKFKETEIGEIPEEWEVKNLGEIISKLADYHSNGSYKILKENVELLDEKDYAVMVRITNLANGKNNDFKYITKSAYDFLEKSKLMKDDIVMSKISDAGSVYLVPDFKMPMSLAMNLFLIRTTQENKFYYYYLKYKEEYVKSFASGTATTTITKDDVRNILIPVVSISEQKKIVKILSEVDKKIDKYKNKKQKLEELKRGLMQQLLTGKIRV